MRYLRMLCNSMAAAALGTAYVIALVLHLNPNLPLHPTRLMPLVRRRAPDSRAAWTTLFVATILSSVAAPLALRGRGTPPVLEARPIDAAFDTARTEPGGRVMVIAIDAGSFDLVTRATAEG